MRVTVDGMLAGVATGLAGLALLGIGAHLVDGAADAAPRHTSSRAVLDAQPPAAGPMLIEPMGLQFDGVPGVTEPAADVLPQSIPWAQPPLIEPFVANDLLIDGTENAAAAASPLSSVGSSLATSLPMSGAMAAFSLGQKAALQLPTMLDSLPVADPLPAVADVSTAIDLPF
ncbi:MAG TPA: hypothetical protein VFR17_14265 [Mycobacterium sp.]|nr:hypothetical protein [Mycobacterium sp.]